MERRKRPESKFETCPNCGGDGELTAQRSGLWAKEPEHYHPAQMVPCPVCGGTGLTPKRGSFEEG